MDIDIEKVINFSSFVFPPTFIEREKKDISYNVRFKILGAKGHVIRHESCTNCYYNITQSPLPKTAKSIENYRYQNEYLYGEEFTKKYIDIITSLGFPVHYSMEGNVHRFEFILAEYDKKIRLRSALNFVRYLHEIGSYYIPNSFFCLMELFPNEDKFKLLQAAHHFPTKSTKLSYGINTNHTNSASCTNKPMTFYKTMSLKEFNSKLRMHCFVYEHVLENLNNFWSYQYVPIPDKISIKEIINNI